MPSRGIVENRHRHRDGRIATAIGKASNPDIQPEVGIVIGGDRNHRRRGWSSPPAASTPIHFILPTADRRALHSSHHRDRRRAGPATGTFATTCTPGPWHIHRMLGAAEAADDLGFLGKGNAKACRNPAQWRWQPGPSASSCTKTGAPAGGHRLLPCRGQTGRRPSRSPSIPITLNPGRFSSKRPSPPSGSHHHTFHTEGAGGGFARRTSSRRGA